MSARNGERFRRLWEGDVSEYGSQSEADCALASHLAYWTGGDEARIDALFRRSALYREKWNRDDYRQRTIKRVLH
jgi:primase-polymerase (primpol)-like protein